MPTYQNSTVDANKLILGNYKIETAPSSGGTYVNVGAGMLTDHGHDFEKYDVQAGNAPDPIEGIAKETYHINFEMIEYDGSVLSAIQCGAITETNTTALSTISGGGNQVLTSRAFRLTNTRLISGATAQTIVTVYKATVDNGLQFTSKGDNDTDPINVMTVAITAEVDATKTAGSQLFSITRTKIA
jgi:hypothetical protein